MHVILHLSESNVNNGLWEIVICRGKSTCSNKCSTVVGDVDDGESMHV